MKGPCAKRRVICQIVYGGDPEEFVLGTNDCENPQLTCPRLPSEGYEKCKSICQQGGHAEQEALREARERGADLTGAVAMLTGHYWLCELCGKALVRAGVKRVVLVLSA